LGNLIQKIEIYQYKLGIKKFEISPNGHFFCLGLFDQTLRIYNSISYTCMSILQHDKDNLNDNTVNYYKEEAIDKEGKTKYIELKPPIDLKAENIYLKGNNLFNDKLPKIGIGKMAFSYDNNFIATKNDNMPNVLFIWDLNSMNLKTVLIHLNEVTYFKWSKNKNMLFISTNNNKLYYFTLDSCKILELAKDFHNKSLTFSYDGKKMIVKDSNSFIVVNIDDNQNNIYGTVLEIPYSPEIQEQQGQGEEYEQQRQYEQMEGQERGQGEYEGEEQAEMINPRDDQYGERDQ
jgi:WD40 repeat protein